MLLLLLFAFLCIRSSARLIFAYSSVHPSLTIVAPNRTTRLQIDPFLMNGPAN